MISVGNKPRDVLSGWLCPRIYHEILVKLLARPVVIRKLDWSCRFCFAGGSHACFEELVLVVGWRSRFLTSWTSPEV